MGFVPLIEVTRGQLPECQHWGAVAVVNRQGQVLAQAGDPYTVTFTRKLAGVDAAGDERGCCACDSTADDTAVAADQVLHTHHTHHTHTHSHAHIEGPPQRRCLRLLPAQLVQPPCHDV